MELSHSAQGFSPGRPWVFPAHAMQGITEVGSVQTEHTWILYIMLSVDPILQQARDGARHLLLKDGVTRGDTQRQVR